MVVDEVQRVFLGWRQPLLSSAAAWLLESGPSGDVGNPIDLSSTLVVVPGRRAGRRLLERLARRSARGRNPGLIPPQLATLGALPERLYRPDRPILSEVEALWLRADSLSRAPAAVVARVFPEAPESGDWLGWLDLAEALERLDADLGVEGLEPADVVELCRRENRPDEDRWRALASLRLRFSQSLDQMRQQDRHGSRIRALRAWSDASDGAQAFTVPELEPIRRVTLVGLLDLGRLFQRLLAGSALEVTALVHAPTSESASFDSWGRPVVDRWHRRRLSLEAASVVVVERPSDQVRHAVATVRNWCREASPPERCAPEEISIGYGDARSSRALLEGLDLAGVGGHTPTGRPMLETQPLVALERLGRYLSSRRLRDLALALRTPSIESYLDRRHSMIDSTVADSDTPLAEDDWIGALDQYSGRSFGRRLPLEPAAEEVRGRSLAVLLRVDGWLRELFPGVEEGSPQPIVQPIADWAEPLARALTLLFPQELDLENPADLEVAEALTLIGDVLRNLGRSAISGHMPRIELTRAVYLLGRALSDQALAGEQGEGRVELLGWLELALDDAPCVIVTGLNEGTIPARLEGDTFLPDSLRSALGLHEDARRIARDLCLLTALLHSRQRVMLLAARQSWEGEPLAPSRLLLAETGADLARGIERFYRASESPGSSNGEVTSSDDEAIPSPVPWQHGVVSRFHLPRPVPLPRSIESLRATAFRDYLRCPYRFYLRHVLQLEEVRDLPLELDARTFGVLTHEVLSAFARSELAASSDRWEIERYLHRALERVVRRRIGAADPTQRQPAVTVQLALLERRLAIFARWQAEQARDGWQIDPSLVEHGMETELWVDGRGFEVTGKIDRVDRNRRGRLRLLDYKTSDTPKSPQQTHLSGGEWVDLQLPLYRKMLADAGVQWSELEIGYVNLSKRASADPLSLATWKEPDYRRAEEVATEVVRSLWRERFWPPAQPPRFDDGLARLCGDRLANRYRARLDEIEEGATTASEESGGAGAGE